MARRPYLVRETGSSKKRLVRASSQQAAVAFVVRGRFMARSVNATELLDIMDTGVKVEDAEPQQQTLDEGEPGEVAGND